MKVEQKSCKFILHLLIASKDRFFHSFDSTIQVKLFFREDTNVLNTILCIYSFIRAEFKGWVNQMFRICKNFARKTKTTVTDRRIASLLKFMRVELKSISSGDHLEFIGQPILDSHLNISI